MERYNNTLMLVTGASSGIGKHAAITLLSEIDQQNQIKNFEIKPIVIGISRRKIDDIKNENFISKTADLSKFENIKKVFEEIDQEFPDRKISVLVNNAGLARAVPILSDERLLETCNPDNSFENAAKSFSEMMNLNVTALTLCTRLAVEKMDHDFPGYIINISSMSSHIISQMTSIHFYTATKFAVKALTEATRQEFRQLKSKIRVGQICPGFVDTGFFEAMKVDNKEFDATIGNVRPMALKCEDVSDAMMMMVKSHDRCQYGDIQLRPVEQVE